MSLLVTSASAASLSLGRSVSARTAVGPALLLLGELGVRWLALHSAKLVGLRALTTTVSSTFLLERERGGLHNTFRLEILDLIRQRLAENLGYDLHSWRELAKNDHSLHGGRKIEASILEVGEVAQHLGNRRSRMGASRNGGREELAKLSVDRADTGGTETLFEVVPNLLYSSKVSDSDLDGGGKAQGNITEHSLGVIIPVVSVIVTIDRLSSCIDKPLALCPKVGLHRGVPLLPVGASEHGDHLVESAGHGEFYDAKSAHLVFHAACFSRRVFHPPCRVFHLPRHVFHCPVMVSSLPGFHCSVMLSSPPHIPCFSSSPPRFSLLRHVIFPAWFSLPRHVIFPAPYTPFFIAPSCFSSCHFHVQYQYYHMILQYNAVTVTKWLRVLD